MSDISKLNINGQSYNIKDTTAREDAKAAREEHDKMLHKETADKQSVAGAVQFESGIQIGQGETAVSIIETGDGTVYFR